MINQKIRIKLKSYDHNLIDKSAEKIVKSVKQLVHCKWSNSTCLHIRKYLQYLKSPHVNKKAREQFKLCSYKRLMDIYSSSAKTVDALDEVRVAKWC